MSKPVYLPECVWHDAESLVDRLEMLCDRGESSATFYGELVAGMAAATAAQSVSLWHIDHGYTSALASWGAPCLGLESGPTAYGGGGKDGARSAAWPAPNLVLVRHSTTVPRVSSAGAPQAATDSPSVGAELALRIEFASGIDSLQRLPLAEFFSAVLGIAALVWLRDEVGRLQTRLADQWSRDHTVAALHRGTNLTQSLTNIAGVIAQHTAADRVLILGMDLPATSFLATSATTRIDPRSHLVRSLQRLVRQIASVTPVLGIVVGQPRQVEPQIRDSLDAYLDESGCRELWIETVTKSDQDASPIAAIVLERFHLPSNQPGDATDFQTLGDQMSSLRWVASDAIRSAWERDRFTWSWLSSRLSRSQARRRLAISGVVLGCLMLWLAWFPVDFWISAEGQLRPLQQATLFAPDNATVQEIFVTDGQRVGEGELLMVLRSSALDLQEKTLVGELTTQQSRLAAVRASKTGGGRDGAGYEIDGRSEQRVLETMVTSLSERLQLVRSQQAALNLQSPLEGIVEREDMQTSLLSRPVTRGQALVRVVSPQHGWEVALDIRDSDRGYLSASDIPAEVPCVYRLRSDPVELYRGRINHLADSVHINPRGDLAVRATVKIDSAMAPESSSGMHAARRISGRESSQAPSTFRVGASVMASVYCGRRPVGFVWFRSLVEWMRTQSWSLPWQVRIQ